MNESRLSAMFSCFISMMLISCKDTIKRAKKQIYLSFSVPAISATPQHNSSKLDSAFGLHDISEREYLAQVKRAIDTIKRAKNKINEYILGMIYMLTN